MAGEHALLSPSSSERWIRCPASVRVANQLPRDEVIETSVYAEEGTAAHALGEIMGMKAFGLLDDDGYRHALSGWRRVHKEFKDKYPEMREHMEAYVELIQERVALFPHSRVFFEQRVQSGLPSCWGTADVVIVSPIHVEIIDLKYGQGVPVDAEGNSQLRLYGIGALESFGDLLGDIEIVRMTVFQPRLESTSTEELTAYDLRQWRDDLVPVAEEALGPDAHFGPSEKACRWCPASGRCAAQLAVALQADFGTSPDLMSTQDMADMLEQLPAIKDWITAFEAMILNHIYTEQKEVPGWKVVLSGGRRGIPDELRDEVRDVLLDAGFMPAQFINSKLAGIGDLEKLLGKAQFASLLSDYVSKSEGKPSVVHITDKREDATPESGAARDFVD